MTDNTGATNNGDDNMMMDDDNNNGRTGFCNGMSMIMSMSGFQSALLFRERDNSTQADCITYLFQNWKLTTSGKYQGAMIYTLVLAIFSEGLSYLQTRIRKLSYWRQSRKRRKQRRLCMSIVYSIQQVLGWSLMLISMTFSVELFLCVIMGITIGKQLFPIDYHSLNDDTDDSTTGSSRMTRLNNNNGNNEDHPNNNNNNDYQRLSIVSNASGDQGETTTLIQEGQATDTPPPPDSTTRQSSIFRRRRGR